MLEPLRGYLLLAERLCRDGPEFAEAWNFGPAAIDARPVQWVAQTLISLWGAGASSLVNETSPQHEAHYLRLDSAKAATLLGWQPRWPLATALEHIVAWHQAHGAGQDMAAVTRAQIERYNLS